MPTPNSQQRFPLNPSPKFRFMQSDQNVSKHREMVDSAEFERAIDYAQLHFMRAVVDTAPRDITGAGYMAASAALFQRIVGMQEFVAVLRTLSETPPPSPAKVNDNLS